MKTSTMCRAVFAAAVVAAATTFAGCATVTTPTKGDPLEGLNRSVFAFNDKVDQYALKPAAKGYQWAVPRPVRSGVTNFFSNIGDIYNAANDLLQLKIADGAEDIMRIAINTVFGVGGIFDVASAAKLPKHQQDLGLTLGHYGVPNGPYLVLPLFGPSTVRDTAGMVGQHFMNPISYINPDAASWGVYGVQVVNMRANLLGASDLLDSAAIDKYSFMRNAYLQRRNYLLTGGQGDAADAPPPKYDDDDGGAATSMAPPGQEGASAGAADVAGAADASGTSGAQAAAANAASATAIGAAAAVVPPVSASAPYSPSSAAQPSVPVASPSAAPVPVSSFSAPSLPASSASPMPATSAAPSPASAGRTAPVTPAAAMPATSAISTASGACSCATPLADGCPAWLMRWCPDAKAGHARLSAGNAGSGTPRAPSLISRILGALGVSGGASS